MFLRILLKTIGAKLFFPFYFNGLEYLSFLITQKVPMQIDKITDFDSKTDFFKN